MAEQKTGPQSVAEVLFGEATPEYRELVARQYKAKTTLWTSLALFSIVFAICAVVLCIKITTYIWALTS